MRRGLGRLLLLTLIVVGAGVWLHAQDLWYRSYDDGKKAFMSGDYAAAEQKFRAALNNRQAPKERGRRVLRYGQLRDEFLPEYYLALTCANLKKWQDALKFAADAERYIKSGDPESAKLVAAKNDAERGINPPRVADAGGTTQPAGATGGGRGAPPVPDPATTARTNFDRFMADGARARDAGRFADARQAATQAKALNVDNKAAEDLLRSTEIQDLHAQITGQLQARAWANVGPLADRLVTLDGTDPLARSARADAAKGLALDEGRRLERAGLSAFYRGDYQGALDTLGKVSADVRTPRVLFYEACSTAALGLIQNDRAKLQKAKSLYQQARPNAGTFSVDRKYVSPQIVRVLDAS